jgi:CheY-like chemotaxis protein
MEVGHVGLVREASDLGQVVREAALLITDYVASKGLDLRLEIQEPLPPVVLDRLRIRQVLLNLFTNAARFTERGQILAQVRRQEEAVAVSIADSGPGICPEDLEGIFQPFVSHDRRRADWRSGTGLGLPISKQFVELHGGRMGVESTIGVGTTVWFTLPLHPVDADGSNDLATTAARTTPELVAGMKPVVVLALPDGHGGSKLVHQVRRHLEGYQVEVANGIGEARERARELKAVAIVADVEESSDGVEGPVPLIRCPFPRLDRLASGLGVADYLVKPIAREDLLLAVKRLGAPTRHILIVDDDRWFVRLLSRMLSSDGSSYMISAAHNGLEALSRLKADRPDLVLLDVALPGLDGIGIVQQMKADPSLRDCQVIIVSAQEGDDGVALAGEVHLAKPDGYQLAELLDVIGAAISKMLPPKGLVAATEPALRGASPG